MNCGRARRPSSAPNPRWPNSSAGTVPRTIVITPLLHPYSMAKASATIQTPRTCVSSASASASRTNASVPTVSGRSLRPKVNSTIRPATCIAPISDETSTASRAVSPDEVEQADHVRRERRGEEGGERERRRRATRRCRRDRRHRRRRRRIPARRPASRCDAASRQHREVQRQADDEVQRRVHPERRPPAGRVEQAPATAARRRCWRSRRTA